MREPEREILVDEAGREWVIEWVSPVFGPPVTDDDAGPATAVCARRFNRRAGDSDLTQVRTRMIRGREGDSPLDPFMALSWGHPPLGGPFFLRSIIDRIGRPPTTGLVDDARAVAPAVAEGGAACGRLAMSWK
jgi:hypothetical protein